MDRYTRNYLFLLGAAVLLIAVWWLSSVDFRAAEINRVLKKDPMLAAYPYPFRVQRVEDGVAVMTSPRSAAMSAMRFLALIEPALGRVGPDDPQMISAEKTLARVQSQAHDLVIAEPDIERVRWVLDRDWLERRGVVLQ